VADIFEFPTAVAPCSGQGARELPFQGLDPGLLIDAEDDLSHCLLEVECDDVVDLLFEGGVLGVEPHPPAMGLNLPLHQEPSEAARWIAGTMPWRGAVSTKISPPRQTAWSTVSVM